MKKWTILILLNKAIRILTVIHLFHFNNFLFLFLANTLLGKNNNNNNNNINNNNHNNNFSDPTHEYVGRQE